jgi:nucleotide-binding universal stress UspA family protein
MLEKVLVCLDGSQLAEQILPYIAAEGRTIKKVVLVQVLASPDAVITPGAQADLTEKLAALTRLKAEMEEAPIYLNGEARVLRDKGLNVECVVLQGKATREIVDYAKNHGISLIAIATHGLSGLREIALGSTAEYILKNSGLPVLMVTPWEDKA